MSKFNKLFNEAVGKIESPFEKLLDAYSTKLARAVEIDIDMEAGGAQTPQTPAGLKAEKIAYAAKDALIRYVEKLEKEIKQVHDYRMTSHDGANY